MIHHILASIKHTDYWQKTGIISTTVFGTISLSMAISLLQALFLVVSIMLALLTIRYTRKKEKLLDKTGKIDD